VTAANAFDGRAENASDPVEFAHPVWDLQTTCEEFNRRKASQEHSWHRLAAFKVLVAVDYPVLAGRDVQTGVISIVEHGAVGTEIHPGGIRVLGNYGIACPDISAAIFLVPLRGWKFEQVYVVAFKDILHNGS
jgi:hypothetical protein